MTTPSEAVLQSASQVESPSLPALISFKQVPKQLPNRVHISAPHRWRKDGVHGVRLRAVKVPGCGWCTTREWLQQFIADVTAASASTEAPKPSPAPRRQRLANAFKASKGRAL